VPVGEEDLVQMKMAGIKAMTVLGSVPRKRILQHYLMSTADIVVQDRDQPQPSGKMLSAIVQGLSDQEQVLIVNWVKRNGSPPKLYGFFPYISKDEGIYAFHACQMPFSDDIRPQNLPKLNKGSKELTAGEIDMARQIVEGASLVDACGKLLQQFSTLPNPTIQNFHQTIVNKAMKVHTNTGCSKDILKPLQPSKNVWAKSEEQASQAKEVFHVEWIKTEKKDVDTVAAVDRADDDDGGQAVKRQRIGDNVVKEEDKEDESLDLRIGNMAGGGDNLHGTSDALAVFERSWREDSETAITEMKVRIEELVDKSTDDRPLLKAVDLFAKLRQRCDDGKLDEPEQFNKVWDEFDVKYRNNSAIAFWVKVLAKGDQLERLRIDDEDPQTLSQPAVAPTAADTAGDDLGVDDDEFD